MLSKKIVKIQCAGPSGAVEVREKTRGEEVILRFLAAGFFITGFQATKWGTQLDWYMPS
jgi:hypothetical protein